MKVLLATITVLSAVASASAQAIDSIYTDFDAAHCAVFSPGDSEAGEPRQAVCPGFGGYPVLFQSLDDNQSLYYGFPPHGELVSRWAGFADGGQAHGVIEWRVIDDGQRRSPVATIHRWSVATATDDAPVEVLVIQKVGLIEEWQGCIVGYVVATGNPDANETARRIADSKALEPECRLIEPAIEQGPIPLPRPVFYGYD